MPDGREGIVVPQAALVVRDTREGDVPELMELFAGARAFMAASGNTQQWSGGWPPEEVIRADVAAGKSHVVTCGGRIVGTFFYDEGEDVEPTYAEIDGAWLDDGPYGVIHRIASTREVPGVGTACLEWAAARNPHQRIDTHEDNAPLRGLALKCGYVRTGIIRLESGDPRVAFERTA